MLFTTATTNLIIVTQH